MAAFNQADVDQFIASAAQMTQAAASYAGDPYSDPGMNGMLAQLQVATASLQVALAQTALRAAQRPGWPTEPETEPEAEAEAEAEARARSPQRPPARPRR